MGALVALREAVRENSDAAARIRKKTSRKKPGLVLASSPAKGKNLAAGTRVAVTVSKK